MNRVIKDATQAWSPPCLNSLKYNFDGAFLNGKMSFEAVIRNEQGLFQGGVASAYWGGSPLEAEGRALQLAIQYCMVSGFKHVIFEGDSEVIINLVKNKELLSPWKLRSISWCDDSFALVYESWYKTRRTRTWVISPGNKDVKPCILFDRSSEDAYSDLGSPMLRRTPAGTYVIAKFKKQESGSYLLLNGRGATPEGNIPFLALFDIKTGSKERIW